jgi:hypothetical protein
MPKPDWFGESIVFNVAAPAAGVAAAVLPPAGTVWHVLSISAAIVTDATVANRTLYIAHVNGLYDTGMLLQSVTIPATTTRYWECTSFYYGIPFVILSRFMFPLGPLCYLTNTNYLRLGVDAMQAGDQISSIYVTCERMLED